MCGAIPLFLPYAFMAWTRINLLYSDNLQSRILLMDGAIIGEMVTNCQLFIKLKNLHHAQDTCKLPPNPEPEISTPHMNRQ